MMLRFTGGEGVYEVVAFLDERGKGVTGYVTSYILVKARLFKMNRLNFEIIRI